MAKTFYAAIVDDKILFRASTNPHFRSAVQRSPHDWGFTSKPGGTAPCVKIDKAQYTCLVSHKAQRVQAAMQREGVTDARGYGSAPTDSWVEISQVPAALFAFIQGAR